MKKIILVFILICLACMAITGCKGNRTFTASTMNPVTPQPTPTPNTIAKNSDDVMLFSFDDGEGDETLYKGSLQSLDLSDDPWHQFAVAPLSIWHHTDTGKGYKIPLNHLDDVWYQTLRSSTPEEYKANIYNYEYLRVWVSNVGEGALTLGVLLSAGMYYFSFLNVDKAIVTSSDGTLLNVDKVFTVDKFIPEAINHGNDSVVLPAGFSGWIAFPLSEMMINYWTASPVAKLSNATTIDFRILSENKKTEYYVIDDVCLTDNEKGTIRTD